MPTETKKITVNANAKSRFQLSADNVTKHMEMIGSREFERACDFAMLQYQQNVVVNAEPNPNGALAGFFRLLGAQEFLSELRRLAIPPPKLEPLADPGNLNHNS